MRLHQIAVERQGALVSRHGIGRLAGILARHPEIIPRLRVRGQERRGGLELRHRPGVIAAFQKFFALEQRAGTGRRAARKEQGQRQEKQNNEDGGWKMEDGKRRAAKKFHPPSSILHARFAHFLWPASALVVASTPESVKKRANSIRSSGPAAGRGGSRRTGLFAGPGRRFVCRSFHQCHRPGRHR